MADCAKYRELVSGYVDGELTEAEKIELDRHLEGCASCRALLAVYQAIHEDCDESATELPEGFSAGVMNKIKALNENAAPKASSDSPEKSAGDGEDTLPELLPVESKERKTKKSYRPAIITLVAAAACLALVFIVSPQLFLGGSRSSSTASEPHMMYSTAASAAASAAPKLGSVPAPAGGSGQAASSRTADNGAEQGDAANNQVSDSKYGTLMVPEATAMPAASAAPASSAAQASLPAPMPSAAPTSSAAPAASVAPVPPSAPSALAKSAPVPSPDVQELRDYYAVIMISGPLPDLIASNARTSNANGTFNIEVTVDMANQLVKDGYTAQMGAPDKKLALVIYSPS